MRVNTELLCVCMLLTVHPDVPSVSNEGFWMRLVLSSCAHIPKDTVINNKVKIRFICLWFTVYSLRFTVYSPHLGHEERS